MSLKRKSNDSFFNLKRKKISMFNQKRSEVKNLIPTEEEQVVYLNKNKTSWIKMKKLTDSEGLSCDEFENLWKNKPNSKLEIMINGNKIKCPRYAKSYLKAYKFSGLNNEADLHMPHQVVKLYEQSKKLNENLNQSLVNWYEKDGSIGKHSDDTKQLQADSEIFSYSFGPASKVFILQPKNTEDNIKFYVHISNNTLIIMGGKCQSTHLHSVPKVINEPNNDGRRINVTFRCFL